MHGINNNSIIKSHIAFEEPNNKIWGCILSLLVDIEDPKASECRSKSHDHSM